MEQLFYRFPTLGEVRDFLELGGQVLTAIGLMTLVMWALIFERLLYLGFGYRSLFRRMHAAWEARAERRSWQAHRIREQWLSSARQALNRNLPLIQSLVAICPLLGLLGTVTGMVEVFEVMAISGSGNPRSMAAGVSKATIPTMAGMVSALSGIAMSAFIQQRARRAGARLEQQLGLDH
ncbi:MAG: MotA/TolQ/ExbB proton channel family protein [Gammaproteobacteria bacterium]